jgi:hypothetical protein
MQWAAAGSGPDRVPAVAIFSPVSEHGAQQTVAHRSGMARNETRRSAHRRRAYRAIEAGVATVEWLRRNPNGPDGRLHVGNPCGPQRKAIAPYASCRGVILFEAPCCLLGWCRILVTLSYRVGGSANIPISYTRYDPISRRHLSRKQGRRARLYKQIRCTDRSKDRRNVASNENFPPP